MNKPNPLSLLLPPILALAMIWTMFWLSTTHPPAVVPAAGPRQDTPEKILDFVRTRQKPVVLVNFWASWCEPCKEELPALLQLEKKLSSNGLKVILVSIDDIDEIDDAETFLRDNQIGFTSFYRANQNLQKFVSQIFPNWSGAVPATVLFDGNLKILDSWEGDTTLEEFEQRVKPFLRGKT